MSQTYTCPSGHGFVAPTGSIPASEVREKCPTCIALDGAYRIVNGKYDDPRAATREWFDALLDAGMNFHPDERFADMVTLATGEPAFSKRDAADLDAAMDYVCGMDFDPCEVGCEAFAAWDNRRTGGHIVRGES